MTLTILPFCNDNEILQICFVGCPQSNYLFTLFKCMSNVHKALIQPITCWHMTICFERDSVKKNMPSPWEDLMVENIKRWSKSKFRHLPYWKMFPFLNRVLKRWPPCRLPLIINLESHCTPNQQISMAKMFREVFGGNFLIILIIIKIIPKVRLKNVLLILCIQNYEQIT